MLPTASRLQNSQMATPKTLSVIHPSVPAWTWVISVGRSKATISVPFKILITTVIIKIPRADRNSSFISLRGFLSCFIMGAPLLLAGFLLTTLHEGIAAPSGFALDYTPPAR